MSWLQPNWSQFVNLTASLRKPLLVPSGYYSPNQSTAWIWSPSPQNVTSNIAVGASPFTYTAGLIPETIYVSGGAVTSIDINGIPITLSMPCTIPLSIGESVTVTYTAAPTMVTDH
jgi:hypothetical protein